MTPNIKDTLADLDEKLEKATKSSNGKWQQDGPILCYGTGKPEAVNDEHFGKI